jgi:hypothetical protein
LKWFSERINYGMNFGAYSFAGTSDRLLCPFLRLIHAGEHAQTMK